MAEARRKFTCEFTVAAVQRLQAGYSVARLARELEVNPNHLHIWGRPFEERPNSAFSGEGRRRSEETQVAELEQKIGQQAIEIDFLKKCLRQLEELRASRVVSGAGPSAERSSKKGKAGPR
jgi:transposase-like protein